MRLKFFLVLFFVLVFLSFFFLGKITIEPDFGWHLRDGQIILKTGFFYKDLFSYTMPSFPVVSHSWGTEVFYAFLYPKFGFTGLSLFFSTVFFCFLIFFLYFFLRKLDKKDLKNLLPWYLSIFVFSSSIFSKFFVVRPQDFSWVLWGVFVLIISERRRFLKYRVIFPFLFLVWSNLHGDFGLGIAVLLFLTIFDVIKSKKIDFINILILLLSILATFINPYGIGLWREVFATYFSTYLRANISEWQPLFFIYFDLPTLFAFVLTSFVVWKYRKHFSISLIIVYILLLIQAVLSIKNVPLWLIFSFIFSYPGIYLFYKELKNKISLERFKKAGVFVLGLMLFLFFFQIIREFNNLIYSSNLSFGYPVKAAQYLKTNLPKGQVFSPYDWGGYLIWKMPQKKVFIDGRMGDWEWNGDKPNESNNAFKDYLDALSGKLDFNYLAYKYNIHTVLWPSYKLIPTSTMDLDLTKIFCNHIYIFICKNMDYQFFPQKLIKLGWKIVYQDNVAVIYRR